jgi:predicted nuclease of predicted toxin-antitoxin system
VRFLVDAQLPPALADWVMLQGHEAFHVSNLALADADDLVVWQAAVTMNAILVTKDSDFINLRQITPIGPAVVWLRIGNSTNRALLKWLTPLFPAVVFAIASGEIIIEVR